MKKQIVIIVIIVLLVVVGLSGCEGYNPTAQNYGRKIVGTWKAISGNITVLTTLTFSQISATNGDVKINRFYNGTWSITTINGLGRIEIVGWTNETNYQWFRFSFKFTDDYNTLTMWGPKFDNNGHLTNITYSGVYIRQ